MMKKRRDGSTGPLLRMHLARKQKGQVLFRLICCLFLAWHNAAHQNPALLRRRVLLLCILADHGQLEMCNIENKPGQ